MENGTSAMQLQGLFCDTFQSALRELPDVENLTAYHGVEIRFSWNGTKSNDVLTPIEKENAAGLQSCLQEGIGDKLEVSYYNGESRTVRLPVVGIGSNDTRDVYVASGMLLIPRDIADALFGDMDTTKMLTVSMKEDSHTSEQDEQMRAFVADYPQLQLYTLTERMENDASSYTLTKIIYTSIGGFVVLFSLVNLLNTLLSGLMARRAQLAMLAALGMTSRQIRSMLNYESLLLAGVNLTATLTLGTLAGWGVCQLMSEIGADYVKFSFPTVWFLLYAVVALGVPILITQICLKSFYKESLIQRLHTTE